MTNGDCASRARRRAISVLPTPVGPIIRMFFGAISSASSGGSFCRRMRLRSAMATARLAAAWPTTYLSSSATIWRGVRRRSRAARPARQAAGWALQLLHGDLVVRVDADAGRDRHAPSRRSRARRGRCVCAQRPRRRQRVGPAAPIATMPVVGLDQIAGAREEQRRVLVEHDQHRFEAAQHAIGAPVLRQLDGRALEVAAVLLELGFEAREERERVGGRAGEAGEDLVVVEPADLARALLDDRAGRTSPGRRRRWRCCHGGVRRGWWSGSGGAFRGRWYGAEAYYTSPLP